MSARWNRFLMLVSLVLAASTGILSWSSAEEGTTPQSDFAGGYDVTDNSGNVIDHTTISGPNPDPNYGEGYDYTTRNSDHGRLRPAADPNPAPGYIYCYKVISLVSPYTVKLLCWDPVHQRWVWLWQTPPTPGSVPTWNSGGWLVPDPPPPAPPVKKVGSVSGE